MLDSAGGSAYLCAHYRSPAGGAYTGTVRAAGYQGAGGGEAGFRRWARRYGHGLRAKGKRRFMLMRNLMGLVPWVIWILFIGGVISITILTIYLIVHIS